MTASPERRSPLWRSMPERGGWVAVLVWAGAALLVTMLVHIAVLAIGGGPVVGPVSYRKPATFAEAGWLLCWITAALFALLSLRRWQRWVVGGAVVLFSVGETTVMAIQAWRGVPSHYNFTTTFDAILMRGGAAGLAGLLMIGLVIFLVATFRMTDLPPSVALGLRAGIVVLVAGSAIGLVMISNMSGVYQGELGTGFGRALTGYEGPSAATVGHEYLGIRPNTDGGDLVLLHAIGVHGLLLVTVPALLLLRSDAGERRRMTLMVWLTASLGAVLAVLAAQAFRSEPWSEMSGVTEGLLAAALISLAGAYGAIAGAIARRAPAAPLRPTT